MRVRVSRTYTGKLWHIRGVNGASICGRNLREYTKELEITDKRICSQCKDELFSLLSKKRRINELLRSALP